VDDTGGQSGTGPIDHGSNRRQLVEIRCGFAELARQEAQAAEMRVFEARRRFDDEVAQLAAAQAALDPGSTRRSKEEAHRLFRKAIAAATTRPQVELAADSWLAEINRINGLSRWAQLRFQKARDASDAAAVELDRLAATAEASRTMAEAAADACRAAQVALAGSMTEAAAATAGEAASGRVPEPTPAPGKVQPDPKAGKPAVAAPTPAVPGATAPLAKRRFGRTPDRSVAGSGAAEASPAAAAAAKALPVDTVGAGESEALVDLRGSKPPAIVRLLRRDRAAMSRLVDWLSSADPEQRRHWQLCLSDFVDAVIATAIDDCYFVFPPGNSFWDQLTADEAREVARGLAALGFRYDGMGAFADDRVPSQRELSMALGQAGLLTVRVRNWPRPEEAAQLYRSIEIDSIALLMDKAPSLTMGELVLMLGRRAEAAADLWNDWASARPLLLRRSLD
jgi:hypothetical protein